MKLICGIAFWVGCWEAFGQGTFQNLDFEAANIVPISGQPNAVTVANALPGWEVHYGIIQQSEIFYNAAAVGTTQVTLYANGYPGIVGPIIDGNDSVLLQGGVNEGASAAASITQTGQIPLGTKSLFFDEASPFFPAQPLDVSIGTDVLTLFPVGNGPNYTVFAADISSWAGQTEQLTFSAPGQSGNWLLDDISFSPNQITVTPEPDALALIGIGGLVFGLYRRIQGNRK